MALRSGSRSMVVSSSRPRENTSPLSPLFCKWLWTRKKPFFIFPQGLAWILCAAQQQGWDRRSAPSKSCMTFEALDTQKTLIRARAGVGQGTGHLSGWRKTCMNAKLFSCDQLSTNTVYLPYLVATPYRFLLSTHYTHYAPFAFFVNLVATVINLIAKLPSMHQVRLFGVNQKPEETTD